jgi:hypothetical protein
MYKFVIEKTQIGGTKSLDPDPEVMIRFKITVSRSHDIFLSYKTLLESFPHLFLDCRRNVELPFLKNNVLRCGLRERATRKYMGGTVLYLNKQNSVRLSLFRRMRQRKKYIFY